MTIKSRSASSPKTKIVSSKFMIISLLILNICTILVLAPMYWRLLIEASSKEPSSDTNSPAAVLRHRRQGQGQVQNPHASPLDRRHPLAPPPPSGSDGALPFIGKMPFIDKDEFNKKYSKYKGLLPSSKRIPPDPSCGRRPDFFDFFLLPKTERSRFHEDKIIYDLFKNMTIPSTGVENSLLPKGTYVELGAFDGKEESNTMFFDKCLGWEGLLIEAQSQSYQRVIENRPNAVKLSFSPTCKGEDGTARFYDYPMSNNGIEGLAKSYAGKDTVEVPCGPLAPVLRDIFGRDGEVSFFSLDVEGAELLVLETLDFDSLLIEVIMVEIQNTHCPEANCPEVHKIRRHMAATGKYALFVDFLQGSDVYVRWGTVAWRRAIEIQQARRNQIEKEMRDRAVMQRQQLIGIGQ